MNTTNYESTKVIPLGSCAFRQPYAQSHCRFIHGYRLQAKFWFACNTLDHNNWVVDFGGLKELKNELEKQFDHTTVVWDKDPELPIFKMLHDKGIIDLRVMSGGVGIEKFAQFCLETADKFVRAQTGERCWCRRVEIWEHENNSAVCTRENYFTTTVTYQSESTPTNITAPLPKIPEAPSPTPPPPVPVIEPVKLEIKSTPISPATTKQEPTSPPLYTTKTTNTFKDPFAGTSWGNNSKRTK